MSCNTPLNTVQAAKELGVSERTMRRWRARNEGPAFLEFGSIVRYEPAALQEFKKQNTRHTRPVISPAGAELPRVSRSAPRFGNNHRLGRHRTMSERRETD